MKQFSAEKLHNILTRLTHRRHFLIAYSGGLDSHVLLHSLAQLQAIHPEISLGAIHLHHGLNREADDWVKHCQKVCQKLNIDYQSQALHLEESTGESPENLARKARYAALGCALKEGDVLLTGHHQNDQAETLLLQLLRGAGPKGMAAMAECSNFAGTQFLRPLLNFTRGSLEAYAKTHQLQWIDDSSNQDLKFDRNFIRHQVLPLIQQRWPSAVTTLTRSAKHCAEAVILLAQTADSELLNLVGSAPDTLSVQGLNLSNPRKQKWVIRRWFEHLHLPTPSEAKLMQIINTVLPCRADALPKVHWQGVEIRRYRDDLYAFAPLSHLDVSACITWDLKEDLQLPDTLGILTPTLCKQWPLYKGGPVTIRFRQGGEYCRPMGSPRRRSLKNLFQEWAIPPWQRQRTPLIYEEEKIIAIPNYCVCTDEL